MQTATDQHLAKSEPVNLRAGLEVLAAAFCLACVGVAYHSITSIEGAAVIATYTLVIPLRLTGLVFSWPFARFVLQAVAGVAGVAGVIYVLSVIINSGPPIVDAFASAILIGVLVSGAAITLRAFGQKALQSVPHLTTASRRVTGLLELQLSLVLSSVVQAGHDESDLRASPEQQV